MHGIRCEGIFHDTVGDLDQAILETHRRAWRQATLGDWKREPSFDRRVKAVDSNQEVAVGGFPQREVQRRVTEIRGGRRPFDNLRLQLVGRLRRRQVGCQCAQLRRQVRKLCPVRRGPFVDRPGAGVEAEMDNTADAVRHRHVGHATDLFHGRGAVFAVERRRALRRYLHVHPAGLSGGALHDAVGIDSDMCQGIIGQRVDVVRVDVRNVTVVLMVLDTAVCQVEPYRVARGKPLDQVVHRLELLRRYRVGSFHVWQICRFSEAHIGFILQLPRQQPRGSATGQDDLLDLLEVTPLAIGE